MRVKHYYLSTDVSGFQLASVILGVPDDIADDEIPFEELLEEMSIEWGHIEIDDSDEAQLQDVRDYNGEPECVIKRDGDKIVVAGVPVSQ